MLYVKDLQKADSRRRYTIETTAEGWEVREEQDAEVVRQARYDDWHRVERAQRAITIEVNNLLETGWQER